MSFADRNLAECVEPIPEELLAGKTFQEQIQTGNGYRAFTRLKNQETKLAFHANSKVPGKDGLNVRVVRRVPNQNSPGEHLKKVKIPSFLKGLADGPLGERGGVTWPPPKELSAANHPTRLTGVPRFDHNRLLMQRSKEQIAQLKEALTAKATSDKERRSTAPTTGPEGQLIPVDQASIDPHEGSQYASARALTLPSGQRLQDAIRQAPLDIDPKQIKPVTFSERIGGLYTPGALIRTKQRNKTMHSQQYDKTYRHESSALNEPEPMPLEWKNIPGFDPALSSFLPLEEFDNTEFEEHEPEERLAEGAVPAKSKFYFEDDKFQWKDCQVMEYSEQDNAFLIKWENDRQSQKWVKRLNLIFEGEDVILWTERVRQATELRAQAEAQMRLWLYVDSQADELVHPLDENQVDRILALVSAEFPLAHLHVIENSLSEMRAMYKYGVKKGIFEYRYQDPMEQARLTVLNLPQPPEPDPIPLKGTIEIPHHKFFQARAFIEDNLFFTHHLLYGTVYTIVAKWDEFAADVLVDLHLHGISLPCELHVFLERQAEVNERVTNRLKNDWAVNITATIQNDLDDHFNFYEDDIHRYTQSRMARFFRTINLIMSHQLRSFVKNSVSEYAKFLSQFEIDVDPENEMFSSDPVENEKIPANLQTFLDRARSLGDKAEDAEDKPKQNFQETASSVSGNVPLFVIKLTAQGPDVDFEPKLEDVTDGIRDVMENMLTTTSNIQGVGDKLFPLLNLGERCLPALSHEDAPVVRASAFIEKILAENEVGPMALRDLYDDFLYILGIEVDTYIEELEQRQPPMTLQDYEETLRKLFTDIELVKKRSLNEVAFTLIKVECYDVKQSLVHKAHAIIDGIFSMLAEQTRQGTLKVSAAYQEMYEAIQVRPENPEKLEEVKKYIAGCGAQIEVLTKEFNHVTSSVELLSKFGYTLEEHDFQEYWSSFSWPRKVARVLEDSEFKLKEERNRFQQELRTNCDQLTEDIAALKDSVEAFENFADESKTEDYYERIKQVQNKIHDYKDLVELYNSREVLFGLPATQWSHIHEITRSFEPYQQLWTIGYDFSQQFPSWHEGLFNQLDADQVEQNVNAWSKTLNVLTKKLKEVEGPATVCKNMWQRLEQFKPQLPLIQALRNPGLRDRHWKKISALIGHEIKPTEDMTLNSLLGQDMLEHIMNVQEISEYASKEYRLEKSLEKMQSEWKNVQYELAPHNDTHVLRGVDDIQQLLDDHITKTQTMLGSPYVKAIETHVKQWETKLLKMQAILDEWLKCQGTWAYLDPIFSSGDIQKSMPAEAQKFSLVNTMFLGTMEGTVKNPYVLNRSQEERLLPNFIEANRLLDQILKQLQQFLETKRIAFPRFYFISNDELLEILSETKDPLLVQPYLKKCFEGIDVLRFESNLDITQIISGQKEVVVLSKSINPADHGNQVEVWLGIVEDVMKNTVKDIIRNGISDYVERSRPDFILNYPGQVVIAVCSLFWTKEVEESMRENGLHGLEDYQKQIGNQMAQLVEMVRGELGYVHRCTMEALVVIEVHARDIVAELITEGVEDDTQFGWLAQLRYYWEQGEVEVRQTNALVYYGYEYLGNTGRLVITPLTDRCYRTLMGALHLNLGGAPEGPAGTGKTETTKDLAKALASQCVVYNCSDQISYREMAKLFKGLSASGAWGCFDEFNRIEIQVLSVIAQQVLTIQHAIQNHKTEFLFEGALQQLKRGCAVFITMNPGYAGRAELPDNLKALFRPVAMMVPDYALIAEISLFSFGFMKGRDLARKIVATYKLCSEQLSSQDHYDYGMRAVKAVLTAAGRLKRTLGDQDENLTLLRAIDDVNRPKFLEQDVALFNGIISDLFPGTELGEPDYVDMLEALTEAATHFNLQMSDIFVTKTLQVYEMVCVRHGVMVVGLSYAGKSCALKSLARALTNLNAKELEKKTQMFALNPKSVTMGQLYGQNDASMEWNDGVLSKIFRDCANDASPDRKWIVLDGPVDAIWIENMNTVLDDNKKLCLVNGDIIPMSGAMNMIFEVQDLAVASPATVSRCGMIYMEPESIGYKILITSWFNALPEKFSEKELAMTQTQAILDVLLDACVDFSMRHCVRMLPLSANTLVASCLRILSTYIRGGFDEETPTPNKMEDRDLQMALEGWITFSIVWSIGANTDFQGRTQFNEFLGSLFGVGEDKKKKDEGSYKFMTAYPDKRTIYDFMFSEEALKWVDWMDTVSEFKPSPTSQYHNIIVPTTDTVRYSYLLERSIRSELPMLFVGETGTGKTIMVKDILANVLEKEKFQPFSVQFSAQTSAQQTQDIIESKLDKRRKGVYGPKIGKKCVIFVDDLNMPALEEYGAQPPIELVRQWLDYNGWYNTKKDNVGWKTILDVVFIAAMGPTGGGRNPITPRLSRHFCTVALTTFDDFTMKKIFGTLTDWMLSRPGYQAFLRGSSLPLVQATLDIYNTVVEKLLPTPEKSHYTFNLRDISKVFQGISLASPDTLQDISQLVRLWIHECYRVFQDRLIDNTDRKWFKEQVEKNMLAHLKMKYTDVVQTEPIVYADYLESNPADRKYTELTDLEYAQKALDVYLQSFNATTVKKMDLVVFNYVLEHVSRISRICQLPFGHALLIGVGGSGRQSATKLAAFIADFKVFQISLTKQYGKEAWREDMRVLLKMAGMQGNSTVFMFIDAQITEESFLEDICSLLNTGEIPNLYPPDEVDNITEFLKPHAKDEGIKDLSKENMLAYFVNRTRFYLHVVMAFSPIGSSLRDRLRKFPSLVNCCTIDWFTEWPVEGLRSVAEHFLEDVDIDAKVKGHVMDLCVTMHQSVRDASLTYLAEMRTHNYVTPTSYLELITAFKTLLASKSEEILKQKNRYEGGLKQLISTEKEVDTMSQTLEVLKPNLLKTAKETKDLILKIEKESAEAEKSRSVVAVEEEECGKKASAAKAIRDDCEAQLADALPALQQAQTALQELDKKALGEVRSMAAPSDKIKRVIEAVCVMLDETPKRTMDPASGKPVYDYWELAKKKVMANLNDFMSRLLNYDVENIKETIIDKIQPYIKDKNFKPSEVKSLSSSLVGLVTWVTAVEKYYRANKIVKPKKALLAEADAEYEDAMSTLQVKKDALKELDDKLALLTTELAENNKKKQELETEYGNTETKLIRATKLMSGLGGERTRYISQSEELGKIFDNIVGDVLISAGMVSYAGPFTTQYRNNLSSKWVEKCKQCAIPGSANFELSNFLGDAVRIQEWKLLGLPSDSFSVDNAIVVTTARRWPLMIDPQGQANNWVKNMERDHKLIVVRPSEGDFHRSIVQAIRTGVPVLLEDVEDDLDPILEPLLLKQVFRDSGMLSITIGDNTVEYNENFRFYMTTKLPRPHYKPEISTKVALVNFVITPVGLQDQLLQKVVAFEEKELEEKKQKFVQQSAQNKARLKAIEDDILRLLSMEGNLLENEEVINTLDHSKDVAKEINAKQAEIESFEILCDKTRNKFLPVAVKASTLFFVTTDMANIDPMYQWSLQWYISLFSRCLKDSEPAPDDRDKRIENINEYMQYTLYKQICRSLFAKDKLLFSFFMVIKVEGVDLAEIRFLLTGGLDSGKEYPASPVPWINITAWKTIHRAKEQLPCLAVVMDELIKNVKPWKHIFESQAPHSETLPGTLAAALPPFHKLLLLRILRQDKLILAIADYVQILFDERYIKPPLFDLADIFEDCIHPWVPLIFILSAGADPMSVVLKFAGEVGMDKRLETLSLGQGQGPRAKQKVQEGKTQGLWVMLQNCHLYADWMPDLQRLVEDYSREDVRGSLNKDFRLWLTCAPTDVFPVSILQNGIKMIVEPPKGLQANLLRSFTADPLSNKEFFNGCTKPAQWKKLVFGLCFFHAQVQERRSFGPLGWNIPYEFNQTDLSISMRQLMMFLDENAEVPYDALTYLVGHCNYGGRVTDDHDRRCLMSLLGNCFTPEIMEDTYKFSPSGIYYVPEEGEYSSYLTFIESLPIHQRPEVFGLHDNADITKDEMEASRLLNAALSTQPRQGGGGGSDSKTVVAEMSQNIIDTIKKEFDTEAAMAKYPITYSESMNTVLRQELIRFNRLIKEILASLKVLKKAIKGEVLMSAQLEEVFNSMYDGKIPKLWAKKSYPSLKDLGAYIIDLTRRIQVFNDWIDNGPSAVFWLSGFFFTQSFLTGVLQNYARKFNIEIDTLQWDFQIMKEASFTQPPADGCYVNGLFLQGCAWDPKEGVLCESEPKVLFTDFPIIWLKPAKAADLHFENTYECPLYKTSERRGVLSTTGHSTNFVMKFRLPINNPPEHWVKRGVALLCQLDY